MKTSSASLSASKEESRALGVYDGDCEACRFWAERWKARAEGRVVFAPYQQVARAAPDVPVERFRTAFHLIDRDGAVLSGAAAVFRVMASGSETGAFDWAYRHVPGFARLSEAGYRLMKRHHARLLPMARFVWGGEPAASSYRLTGRVFLQALGTIYVMAFLSLFFQLAGLVGDQGLLPVRGYLETIREHFGAAGAWYAPTLAWLDPSGGALRLLALLGTAAGCLVIGGIFVGPSLILAWISYLSLAVAGQDFTSAPWDLLLLEAGFLAIFLAPGGWSARYRSEIASSRTVVLLFRFLLFRLVFGAALASLARGGIPLAAALETQPLPTALAWHLHAWPGWMLAFGGGLALAIGVIVPFFYFGPRRLRLIAAGATALLQIGHLLLGNAGHLHWLALALCLFLLDDRFLSRIFRRKETPSPSVTESPARRSALAGLAAAVVALGLLQLAGTLVGRERLPRSAMVVLELTAPLSIVHGYGPDPLPSRRSEVVIEGSEDGTVWKEYGYRARPGEVKRMPGWIAPFDARLDRLLTRAADGPLEESPWLVRLAAGVHQGVPDIVALFGENPFPESPPRFVRATLYAYRFTTPEERAADGAWWRRTMKAELLSLP